MAKLGSFLFVTLTASGQVAQVDVSTPSSPVVRGNYDLTTLNLNTYGGAPAAPEPWGITAFQNQLYVAVRNNYSPSAAQNHAAGDGGLIAILNPGDGGIVELDVGSDVCLEPLWLAPSGDGSRLFVSCAGEVDNSGAPNFNTVGVHQGAVVSLNASGQRVASWSCASVSGGTGCNTFSPNTFAVHGTRLYVGDTSFGRMLVLESQDGGLSEAAGFGSGTTPLTVCPLNAAGNSNVSSVVSVP
jgi:hypothetical protein